MNTVEILIYMVFAFIIGGLVLGFLVDWDYGKTYTSIRDGLLAPQEQEFQTIEPDELVSVLMDLHRACERRTKEISVSVHVDGEGSFTKGDLYEYIKEIHYCTTFPSSHYQCGQGERIDEFTIELPSIITFTCKGDIIEVS